MPQLKDSRKNGKTIADFSLMMIEIDLEPQRIGRKEWLSDQLSHCLIQHYQPSDVRSTYECPQLIFTDGWQSQIYARTDHYASCHSCLHTVESCSSGAWLDYFGMMLTLATNSVSNCILKITTDVSGEVQVSWGILPWLLHVTQALRRALWSMVYYLLWLSDPFGKHFSHTNSTVTARQLTIFYHRLFCLLFAILWTHFLTQ